MVGKPETTRLLHRHDFTHWYASCLGLLILRAAEKWAQGRDRKEKKFEIVCWGRPIFPDEAVEEQGAAIFFQFITNELWYQPFAKTKKDGAPSFVPCPKGCASPEKMPRAGTQTSFHLPN